MIKLSKTEKRLVVAEISRRCKDFVYMEGDRVAKDVLSHVLANPYINQSDSSSEIFFTFEMKMCLGDIQQIVGRHRRERGTR